MLMKPVIAGGACGLVALLAASPAAGQQAARPERPYRGLFASEGGNAGGDTAQNLAMSASLGAGFDDNILADALRRTGPGGLTTTGQDGVLRNAGAGLTYSLNLVRFTFEVAANSGVRYYPAFASGERWLTSEDVKSAASLRLTGSTTVSAVAGVTYRPENLDRVFAATDTRAGLESNDVDLPTTFDHYRRYGGSAGLTQKLSRRTTLHADYGHRRAEGSGGPRLISQRVGGGLTVGVARGLALKAGYRYSQSTYYGSLQPRREHHTIDAGIDYSRALSFSRRTTLSFSTGSSAVQQGDGRTRYAA